MSRLAHAKSKHAQSAAAWDIPSEPAQTLELPMAYIVTKTIKGKPYRYLQWSYRVGKKVKTRCRSLGREIAANVRPYRRKPNSYRDQMAEMERRQDRAYASAMRSAERIDAQQREEFGMTGAERQALYAQGIDPDKAKESSTEVGQPSSGASQG